jgi:Fe2+ or Zn2+ uptake regulation protein
MNFLEKAEKLMMQYKHKLTKPRIQVINYFSNSSKPVSPYDIVKENPELDVVSVYRTIELLESL